MRCRPLPSTGMTPYLPASTYQVPISAMSLSRLLRRDVVVLREVLVDVVQLPAGGVELGERVGGDGLPEPDARLGERRAGPGADRAPAVVVDRPAAEHLEVLRVVVAGGRGVVEASCAKLTPCSGDWVTPRIVAGGSMPSTSSTVGTMSMMCAYCVRTSPRAAMPRGQETMNGSEAPPR